MVVKAEMVQTGTKRAGEACTAFLPSLVISPVLYCADPVNPSEMDLRYAW